MGAMKSGPGDRFDYRLSDRELDVLNALEKATVLFMGRLLTAIREGLTTEQIERVTGLPETVVYGLVIHATEAQ